MKKAIVTGATGFVGSYLVAQLSAAQYSVCAMVRSHAGKPVLPFPKDIRVVACELSEYRSPAAAQALRMYREADIFYHLAWEGSAGPSRGDYMLQLANVRHTCDAVSLASELGCARFVGAGSIMEDECLQALSAADANPPPTYHYSIAKHAAFLMAKTEAAKRNMPFLWGKISNAYGANDPTERFINTMLRKMLKNEPCLLSPCTQTYDFIYISELARAFQRIGEDGSPGEAYYIGSGKPAPLRAFVETMRGLTGTRSPIQYGALPCNAANLDAASFDHRKLWRDTGFVCQIDFAQGIGKTLNQLQIDD